MKLVTFEVKTVIGAVRRIGVLRNQNIIDLQAIYASYLREGRGVWSWQDMAASIVPTDMLRFIEGGELSMEEARLGLDYLERRGTEAGRDRERFIYQRNEVRLMAPIPRPVSIRDCSAFLLHLKSGWEKRGMELPKIAYELPIHYRGSSTDVAGPEDPILWPDYTEKLDYELEFAACIGKYGVNIPVEKAKEHIFGYTLFNDISARDIQDEEMRLYHGPAKGKSFQNSNIMGPCLVTPDEIDPDNLRMKARVNGELWSDGNSGDMYFKFPQLVAYLSKSDPLYPGEFIGSGTVGSGCGAEINKWIKPGDVIELEAEGIGVLRNRVVRNG